MCVWFLKHNSPSRATDGSPLKREGNKGKHMLFIIGFVVLAMLVGGFTVASLILALFGFGIHLVVVGFMIDFVVVLIANWSK